METENPSLSKEIEENIWNFVVMTKYLEKKRKKNKVGGNEQVNDPAPTSSSSPSSRNMNISMKVQKLIGQGRC